jgi:diacylglycerol kinase (ATP)
MAEVGFNAHLVRRVDPRLKRWAGKGAYAWAALGQFVRQRPLLYDVEAGGRRHRAAAVVVANGRYYGGRFVFAPAARVDVPSFELCLVEGAGRWQTLRYGAGLLLGFLPRLAGYRIETVHRVRITNPAGEPVQCDGDDAAVLPLEIGLDPTPLSVIVPRF